jgi:dTDP-4-amino-4,6-dideoxygalactose transaminase
VISSHDEETIVNRTPVAILGGQPTRTDPYPAWPVHDDRDVEAVTRVVRSGRWGGFPYPGPETERFATRFAALQGGGYAVPMVNGTITMEVALRAADIGWGDEVIVPAYTFQATAAAPMAAGAVPVIVDVDPATYCIDPAAVEAAITPRTRAIIPVHLGASMADMDAIMTIAERHDLVVIEDCAHMPAGMWHGRGAGTIGHFGSFSLQSSKTLTAGEGGVLLCRTPELAARVTSIIDCGRPHDPAGVEYTQGGNFRMTELQAALANVGLDRLPAQVEERAAMAEYLDTRLPEVPGIRVLRRDPRHTTRAFYRYVFAVQPEDFGLEHDALCTSLDAEGIPCWVGYEAMHRYTLFQPQTTKLPVPSAFPDAFRFETMSFPVAERACEHEAVWLDERIFRAGPAGVDDVIEALWRIHGQAGEISRALAERA